ncbi:MAG: hypothetical protein IT475_11665 [Aquimonas sp.]|nr:hypothetical protein [Xanthomonadales bacterium]MCC6506089.1 hypothetical protein [Aquimonas sp.]
MKTFNTHVYAVVRVKVLGTTFSENIKEIANRVADAVFTWPHVWHTSASGDLLIGDSEYRIEHTEVADEMAHILVDEIDSNTGDVVAMHWFDAQGEFDALDASTSRKDAVIQEAIDALTSHPEAALGNSKVHFALMRLQGLGKDQS